MFLDINGGESKLVSGVPFKWHRNSSLVGLIVLVSAKKSAQLRSLLKAPQKHPFTLVASIAQSCHPD